jgi:acetyl-CoA acetyltransferase
MYASQQPVVVGLLRSPLGLYGGALAGLRVDDALATLLRHLVTSWPHSPLHPEALLLGCANQAGEDARNLARLAVLLADLPLSCVGITYHALCLSGMAAWDAAVTGLAHGRWRCVLVGAAEHMSRAPWAALPHQRDTPDAWQHTVFGWRFTNPRFKAEQPHVTQSMVALADTLARRQGYTRPQLDAISWQSRQHATSALSHATEAPYRLPYPELSTDEALGRPVSTAMLARLKALEPEGLHTAAQAARWADGCLVLALSTRAHAQVQGWPILAEVIAGQWVADYPTTYAELPQRAAQQVLTQAGLNLVDVPIVEIHEGFAATVLHTALALGLADPTTPTGLNPCVNALGGGLAVGMPQAMAGLWALYRCVLRLQGRPKQPGAPAWGLAMSGGGMGQGYAGLLRQSD